VYLSLILLVANLDGYNKIKLAIYFLSILLLGLILGGWWAYQEGSWGGWWNW
jgi:cytochrome c biogenesis factor